jgi:PQQ-dependent catabolism-associated beta-propeller protein
VANEDDALLSVVDIPTRTLVKEIAVGVEPEGVAVSPDGRLVAVTSETTNMVHLIEAGSLEIVANILVDQRPRYAEFSPRGGDLWVSSEIGGTVSVIDVTTRTIRRRITFEVPGLSRSSIQPVGIKFAPTGKIAFVALGPANRIAVVATDTFAVTSYILVGQRVWHLSLNESGTSLLTTNGLSDDVTVVDVASLRPVKSVKVGRQPWGIAFRQGLTNAASAP